MYTLISSKHIVGPRQTGPGGNMGYSHCPKKDTIFSRYENSSLLLQNTFGIVKSPLRHWDLMCVTSVQSSTT